MPELPVAPLPKLLERLMGIYGVEILNALVEDGEAIIEQGGRGELTIRFINMGGQNPHIDLDKTVRVAKR